MALQVEESLVVLPNTFGSRLPSKALALSRFGHLKGWPNRYGRTTEASKSECYECLRNVCLTPDCLLLCQGLLLQHH